MRFCKKLAVKFIKPFQIFKKKDRVVYKLHLPVNIKIYLIFYILLLEKYKENFDIADTSIYKL